MAAKFYDLLETIVTKQNIPPENIYNPDEKGVQLGKGNKTQVLVDRDQKVVQATEHGNRELVTIIETVCADGTSLPPSVIFEGSRVNAEWGRVNPAGARYVTSCYLSDYLANYLVSVSPFHPMGGQTVNSELYGCRKISYQLVQLETNPDVGFC